MSSPADGWLALGVESDFCESCQIYFPYQKREQGERERKHCEMIRVNGDSRPQGSTGRPSGRPSTCRVRFPDEEESPSRFSPQEWLMDVITAFLASLCVTGLMTILIVLYLTVRPFSLQVYRRLAAQLGAASFVDATTLLLPNVRIFLTGDSDIPSPVGTSLLVSNHLFDADWWELLMLGRCVGLRGSLKVFLRNEYLHINMQNVDHHGNSSTRTNGVLTTASSSSSKILMMSTTRTESANASTNGHTNGIRLRGGAQDLTIMAKLLHLFLEFPLINGEDYISDREQLFQLLRSFADSAGASVPVHLLFFPEGWCLHGGEDRQSILAKSNQFAYREGRPQLKHLLLPRTRGFHATLECLRESSPLVYDVTMAYSGYDGSLPPSAKLSMPSLWGILRRKIPKEIHLRIKRYSMEEVLQDSAWLDKKWAEKDRLLSHFVRHQSFPMDSRGYYRPRVFDTRHFALENSTVALVRLLLLPGAVPFLLFLSIPLFWTLLLIWIAHRAFMALFPDSALMGAVTGRGPHVGETSQTPGSASANGTPYFPATPFASPTVTSWRDILSHRDDSS